MRFFEQGVMLLTHQGTLFSSESLISKCTRKSTIVKSINVNYKMSSESASDEFDFEFVSKAAKRTQGMYI